VQNCWCTSARRRRKARYVLPTNQANSNELTLACWRLALHQVPFSSRLFACLETSFLLTKSPAKRPHGHKCDQLINSTRRSLLIISSAWQDLGTDPSRDLPPLEQFSPPTPCWISFVHVVPPRLVRTSEVNRCTARNPAWSSSSGWRQRS